LCPSLRKQENELIHALYRSLDLAAEDIYHRFSLEQTPSWSHLWPETFEYFMSHQSWQEYHKKDGFEDGLKALPPETRKTKKGMYTALGMSLFIFNKLVEEYGVDIQAYKDEALLELHNRNPLRNKIMATKQRKASTEEEEKRRQTFLFLQRQTRLREEEKKRQQKEEKKRQKEEKQQQKEEEKKRQKEEKQQQKEEEKKRQKEEKQRQKEEKKRQKEEKQRQKEEKKRQKEEEKKRQKNTRRYTYTQVGDPIWYNGLSITNTMQYSQTNQELPRKTIADIATNASASGAVHNRIEISDTKEANEVFERNPDLKEQLMKCSIAKQLISDLGDERCVQFKDSVKNALSGHVKCHSLHRYGRYKKHANRHCKELPKSYAPVGKSLGMNVISSSVFSCDKSKAKKKTNKKIAKIVKIIFLCNHQDSNCLPVVFISYSAKPSYVYYTYGMSGPVIGRLPIPAGLSAIYTTEINSGSKLLNEYNLFHFSSSHEDRLLFRLVHQTANDTAFNLDQEDLVDKIIRAVKTIFRGNQN